LTWNRIPASISISKNSYQKNFLIIQKTRVNKTLKSIIVVMGIKILMFGLSITISPGKWKKGILIKYFQNKPTRRSTIPIATSNLFI